MVTDNTGSKSGDEKIILPLSLSQHQVWLDQQSHPGSAHFNIGGMGFVNGKLDLPQLTAALQQLVDESEALRLLPLTDGRQQLVSHWQQPLLDFYDLSDDPDAEKTAHDWWQASFLRPFILDGQHRPWCITLFRISEQHYGMTAQFHHLVMDGYSVALALRQLGAIYNNLSNSPDNNPPESSPIWPPPGQRLYQQFIAESQAYANSDSCKLDGDYWHEILPELPPTLLQKRDGQSSSETNGQSTDTTLALAHHHYDRIPWSEYQQLQKFAKHHKVTTFHLFIAALAIYFCRTFGKQEIVMGLPVLNRGGKRYKHTLGMYVAVIPLRINIAKTSHINELLPAIAKSLRRAYRYARYPLDKLVRELDMIKQGQDRLFDVVLSFEIHNFDVFFGDAPLQKTQQLCSSVARYPLTVSVCEFYEQSPVDILLESSADYFTAAETKQLGSRLHRLLMQMASTNETSVKQLQLLLDEEYYDQIVGRHADVPQHTDPLPFVVTFEHQAALRPSNIAIRWQSGEINYGSLNQQANRLAHRLMAVGVKKDLIVAVVLPRQAETIMAFLAVAKAGGAFVPLTPDAPTARLQKLIQISGAVAILTGQSSAEQLKVLGLPIIIIDNKDAPQYNSALPSSNPKAPVNSDDLAYLLFTSGSTGTPKGVLMAHAPLARRLAWLARTFAITPKDVALQSIQLTFDPAMIEIFLPLTHGGSIALPPPGQIAPDDIARYAEDFAATHIIFVPTTLRYFNQNAKNHPKLKLRVAISGGEVLHRALAADFVKQTGAQLFNLYGPTEACVFATALRFELNGNDDPLPIGQPVDDTQIYVLDDNLQLLPAGTPGEIFIGGNALARGYISNGTNTDNDLTSQRFIADPFMSGQRMYRSGDNGYWNQEGQLCFVNRIDNQIKLRGQRIEPAEIETVLADIAFVLAAAVKKVGNELHAWVVLKQPDSMSATQLHNLLCQTLQQQLPEHMVPASFTRLSAMPRQVSGKLDYKALKPSPMLVSEEINNEVPPHNDLEKLLLNLFGQTLQSTSQDISSNFFKAGGDSISALNLLSSIDAQIGQRLPLSLLLQNPTVASLAMAIVQRQQPLLLDLSQHNGGAPVYLAASGHGDALRFAPLADALGDAFNLHMLQPPIDRGYVAYHSIAELADHYVSMIEQHHHKTPPILAGFSIGGIAALEAARRLVGRGVPIGGLILIDTTYPLWLLRRSAMWRLSGWLVKTLRLQELSINQRTMGSLFGDPGLNSQIEALKSYQPTPFSLPTTLVISSGFNRWHRLLFKPWHKQFNGQLSEQHMAGFHGTLFAAEHVRALANIIRLVSDKKAGSEHNPD